MQNLQRSFSQGSLLAGTLTYNIYKNTKKEYQKSESDISYQQSAMRFHVSPTGLNPLSIHRQGQWKVS